MPLTAWVTTVAEARSVERVRVRLRCPERGPDFVDEHVRVALPAPGAWAWAGDVVHEGSAAPCRPGVLAARYPGALVVAAHDGGVCRLRVGPRGAAVVLRVPRCGASGVLPWPVWASLVHACVVAGVSVEGLRLGVVRVW